MKVCKFGGSSVADDPEGFGVAAGGGFAAAGGAADPARAAAAGV